MKISESKLSLVGKARSRPDQVRKVVQSVRQQGLWPTYQKVMNRLDSYTPLGYASAGTIVEVGSNTSEFQVGQRVACAGNKYALHAEYNAVPSQLCVAIPELIDTRQAAFATVASIALHGFRQADMQIGECACVIGLGLIGQILVRILRASGIFVIGFDLSEERCRQAEAGGASCCTVFGASDMVRIKATIDKITAGAGADVIFLTAGGKDNGPVELAADLARDRARVVDIGKCRMDIPWNSYYDKELEVRFSRSYGPGRYDPTYEELGFDYPIGYVRWTERRNMAAILAMMEDGRLDLSSLITDVFDFAQAVDVYEKLNDGRLSGLGIVFRYETAEPPRQRLAVKVAPARSLGPAVRLGVIGCGNYASSQLIPHLLRRSDVQLVEVVTNTALSAANAQKKFGFQRMATDSAGLVESDDIDAVVIATRHASHADLTCRALRAGKAVFVEKPLAISRAQLDLVMKTIEETGNDRLMVGFNRRFSPLLRSLKETWGGRVGAHVLHYRVHAGMLDSQSWYADATQEGTRFVGEGGHFIDTLSWWLDLSPDQVFAYAAADDPDNLTAIFHFSTGSVATISYLTHGDPRTPKEYLEIFGDGRTARFENFRRFEVWHGGRHVAKTSRSVDKGQRSQLDAFLGALTIGGPMPIPFPSLVRTTLASLAVGESIARNAPVSVDPDAIGEVETTGVHT